MNTVICAFSGEKAENASLKLNSKCGVFVVFPNWNSKEVVEFFVR
jgi:hypothetical protein